MFYVNPFFTWQLPYSFFANQFRYFRWLKLSLCFNNFPWCKILDTVFSDSPVTSATVLFKFVPSWYSILYGSSFFFLKYSYVLKPFACTDYYFMSEDLSIHLEIVITCVPLTRLPQQSTRTIATRVAIEMSCYENSPIARICLSHLCRHTRAPLYRVGEDSVKRSAYSIDLPVQTWQSKSCDGENWQPNVTLFYRLKALGSYRISINNLVKCLNKTFPFIVNVLYSGLKLCRNINWHI